MREFSHNVRRGLALGLMIATGLSLWITLLRLAFGNGVFEARGLDCWRTVLRYFLGFSVGGVMLGALMPLRRWALGSRWSSEGN